MATFLSSFFYALGYLIALSVFVLMARRRGMATQGVWTVMQVGLIGGLAGANISQWAFGAAGGKTVLGGVAFGYLCVALCKRRLGLMRATGDLFAPAICAGEAVGRFGCFFGGCCYGKAANVPWAVWQHGAWRHPTQIYTAFACAAILAALWRFSKSRPPENGLFYAQGALYCFARFMIEFFREGPPLAVGLSVAQWACVAGELFFGVMLVRLMAPRVAMNAPPVIYDGAFQEAGQ